MSHLLKGYFSQEKHAYCQLPMHTAFSRNKIIKYNSIIIDTFRNSTLRHKFYDCTTFCAHPLHTAPKYIQPNLLAYITPTASCDDEKHHTFGALIAYLLRLEHNVGAPLGAGAAAGGVVLVQQAVTDRQRSVLVAVVNQHLQMRRKKIR